MKIVLGIVVISLIVFIIEIYNAPVIDDNHPENKYPTDNKEDGTTQTRL